MFPYTLTSAFILPAKPSQATIARAIDNHRYAVARLAEVVDPSVAALGNWVHEHRSYTPEHFAAMREECFPDLSATISDPSISASANSDSSFSPDSSMRSAPGPYDPEALESSDSVMFPHAPESLDASESPASSSPESSLAAPSSPESSDPSYDEDSMEDTSQVVNTMLLTTGTRWFGLVPPYERGGSNWTHHVAGPNSNDRAAHNGSNPDYWTKN